MLKNCLESAKEARVRHVSACMHEWRDYFSDSGIVLLMNSNAHYNISSSFTIVFECVEGIMFY